MRESSWLNQCKLMIGFFDTGQPVIAGCVGHGGRIQNCSTLAFVAAQQTCPYLPTAFPPNMRNKIAVRFRRARRITSQWPQELSGPHLIDIYELLMHPLKSAYQNLCQAGN